MYSQNNEEKVILDYFGDFIGTCLSIGENDGKTYSNVLSLIENGWNAVLVEPSPLAFNELVKTHDGNERVILCNVAIGEEIKEVSFYEGVDFLKEIPGLTPSLVSTAKYEETNRWGGSIDFEEKKVKMITFDRLIQDAPYRKFDFISIDAEGYDWDILRQMDLKELECRCVCIEHNSISGVKEKMYQHCVTFGLTQILTTNAENIIISK
jgi:FkbM family methyltransferase